MNDKRPNPFFNGRSIERESENRRESINQNNCAEVYFMLQHKSREQPTPARDRERTFSFWFLHANTKQQSVPSFKKRVPLTVFELLKVFLKIVFLVFCFDFLFSMRKGRNRSQSIVWNRASRSWVEILPPLFALNAMLSRKYRQPSSRD